MPPRDDRPLVLIVEDEENIASFARMYLEAAGYQVLHAARGDDGLRMAQDHRPALLVLDLMLPGIDGYEVTRRLRQADAVAQTPITQVTVTGKRAAALKKCKKIRDAQKRKKCKRKARHLPV